jgi:hypothetical protein
MQAFLEGFDSVNEIFERFNQQMDNEIILFGVYDYGNYEGSAWVGFLKDGKLYEVHGSHCSCYGLENQWGPEETSVEEIVYRINNGGQSSYEEHHEKILKSLNSLILKVDLEKTLKVNEENEKVKFKI